jgi:hypothetical protein
VEGERLRDVDARITWTSRLKVHLASVWVRGLRQPCRMPIPAGAQGVV